MRRRRAALAQTEATLTPDAPIGGDRNFRRCLATGELRNKTQLIRFVVSPQSILVPDIAGRLPGRGLWVTATRMAVEDARRRKLFAKAARSSLQVVESLADEVAAALCRHALDLLGLARSAGLVIFGADKVAAALASGHHAILIEARDASPRESTRFIAKARAAGLPVVTAFTAHQLSLALGRENVVHAALGKGRLSERFLDETLRLGGFRDISAATEAGT